MSIDRTNHKQVTRGKLPKLPPPVVVKTVMAITNWLETLRVKLTPPSVILLEKITSYWTSQAIYVVAELNIADQLETGPKTCRELAQATNVDEQALYRLLRALASVGVFAEQQDGSFKLTSLSACLRTHAPGSLHKMALMNGLPFHWKVWGTLLDTVKTGETGFNQTFGMDSFTYFNQNLQDGDIFNGAMASLAYQDVPPILAAYDFTPFTKVVDIGGGEGILLTAILEAYPHLRGALFDRPAVTTGLQDKFSQSKLSGRIELVAGDFFQEMPPGYDVYLMRNIIHDFSDEKATTILQKCRAAMSKQARLLVIEMILPSHNGPFPGKLLDLQMLMLTPGGRERTQAEYQKLVEAAGFRLNRVIPTIAPSSIMELLPLS